MTIEVAEKRLYRLSVRPSLRQSINMKLCSTTVVGYFLWIAAAEIGLKMLSKTVAATTMPNAVIEEVSCFNTIFSVSCTPNQVIVFESARYGRNDTHLAARCGVPFSRHCDIDVHFLMNRACAGRRKCNVMVNTALFGDPCGYEEFLRITYLCVPASAIHNTCHSAFSPTLYDHGYLSTPNYPDKYFMDADCTWKLAVQSHQTIRVIIFDFELDLKRAGNCKDFLEIHSGDRSFFKDCGILGKQTVEVNASNAIVRFVTGQSSLTQRGFFLYFEAVGIGCPNLMSSSYGAFIVHFLENDVLSANVTCADGMVFAGHDVSFLLLKCTESSWSRDIPDCIEPEVTEPAPVRRLTVPSKRVTIPLTDHSHNSSSSLSKSASIIGFALGVLSSILFVVLLVLVILYCYMKRKNRGSGRNVDKWRVVINNLQEHATKQEHATYQHFPTDDNLSNILRTHCPRRQGCRLPNTSVKTSHGQQQARQHVGLLTECTVDNVPTKGTRPSWIEIPQSYSVGPECTCQRTDVVTISRCSARTEVPSVNLDGILERDSCLGTDCQLVERSRQTISPCCSHWGATRSNIPPMLGLQAPLSEVELNSPDFIISQSAPDLFTIARHADQLNVAEDMKRSTLDEFQSEQDTLLSTPDAQWMQRDNQALSPVSPATKLSLKESGVFSNVLRPTDKRID